MGRLIVGLMLSAVVALGVTTTRGDELGGEIDLTAFGNPQSESQPAGWEDRTIQEISLRDALAGRRFYISGMIGPSFASLNSPVRASVASSDTLFNAGGALGIAVERRRGWLRLEVEGMGRGPYDALEANQFAITTLTSNWSVTTNMWRDFMITERFGMYGGAGIGGGGYTLSERLTDGTFLGNVGPGGAFAWQAGGGLLWQISDRLTFDVGYRYFQIDALQQQPRILPNQFSANELMFSLRLYEPFRNLRNAGR